MKEVIGLMIGIMENRMGQKLEDKSGSFELSQERKRSIIDDVFGGSANLDRIIEDTLQSSDLRDVSRKMSDQDVAKIILKNVSTEGYERSDCLKVVREAVWRRKKQRKKAKLKHRKFLVGSSEKQLNREAWRAGYKDGEEYEKFLEEN